MIQKINDRVASIGEMRVKMNEMVDEINSLREKINGEADGCNACLGKADSTEEPAKQGSKVKKGK